MHINPTQPTVAEYCDRMEKGEIVVNKDYQRSNQVWPPAAKSFLIETILLGYPMPKLALHQKTSVKTRRTLHEIIDGQQRSQAILEYYRDDFKLSPKLGLVEARSKKYSQLPEDLQSKFVSYGIPVDVFVAATEDEIRETFRRMNSYNVPLNNEERRHARYQGAFKWFINRMASKYSGLLISLGVMTDRQVFRMVDAKLLTEIAIGLEWGIKTSSPKDLDKIYDDNNGADFPNEEILTKRLDDGIDFLLTLTEIHGSVLMKQGQFYSLLLAISHYQAPVEALKVYAVPKKKTAKRTALIARLVELADAAEAGPQYDIDESADEEDVPGTLVDAPDWNVSLSDVNAFARASAEGTNTINNRVIRFRFFYDALTA